MPTITNAIIYVLLTQSHHKSAHSLSGYGNSAPLTNGSAGSPLGRTAGSPPVTGAAGAGPSPMAALMSVADTLPPGSPRSAGGSPPQAPQQQRSNSRSSQHSPNSSGKMLCGHFAPRLWIPNRMWKISHARLFSASVFYLLSHLNYMFKVTLVHNS